MLRHERRPLVRSVASSASDVERARASSDARAIGTTPESMHAADADDDDDDAEIERTRGERATRVCRYGVRAVALAVVVVLAVGAAAAAMTRGGDSMLATADAASAVDGGRGGMGWRVDGESGDFAGARGRRRVGWGLGSKPRTRATSETAA